MDDKEINEYCDKDVEVLSNYELYSRIDDIVSKATEKLIKQYYILDEEIYMLKIKNKLLYLIIALLVILKIIGG